MKNSTYSQDAEWLCRCEDFERYVQKYKCARFSHFISPHDEAVFRTHYRCSADVSCMTWGGTDDAERVMLGFFPDFLSPDASDFPIETLEIKNAGGTTHRDILGALIGLGIKRETLGDIYFDEDRAYVMCERAAAEYILYNLETVGRKKVEVQVAPQGSTFSLKHQFKMIRVTVSALRLDAVLAAIVPMSRSDAAKAISQEYVNVNFTAAQSPDKRLSEGDVISVRHKGRFVLTTVAGETRKGRTVIEVKKYI